MTEQDEKPPWFAYALAFFAGLFFLAAPFLLLAFLSVGLSDSAWFIGSVFVVTYALLGAAFGFVWPEKTWRWGVWVSLAPVTLFSFMGGGVMYFLLFTGLTLLPACAGAWVGSRLHLAFTEVK